MKISYNLRWNPKTGTAYRQTVRITEQENKRIFNNQFKPGINYGNAYTGSYIASKIYNLPEYKKQLDRLIVHNTVVFVGLGKIPVY
jgi:3-hydroxy-3-methylglutaryl CoA synthase